MSVPACYRRIWFAPVMEMGVYPFIFTKKPTIIRRDGGIFVFDLARNCEVEIIWCREYRQRKYRAGHKGRT